MERRVSSLRLWEGRVWQMSPEVVSVPDPGGLFKKIMSGRIIFFFFLVNDPWHRIPPIAFVFLSPLQAFPIAQPNSSTDVLIPFCFLFGFFFFHLTSCCEYFSKLLLSLPPQQSWRGNKPLAGQGPRPSEPVPTWPRVLSCLLEKVGPWRVPHSLTHPALPP